MSTIQFQQYFSQPLVELSCESPKYAAVYAPQSEVGNYFEKIAGTAGARSVRFRPLHGSEQCSTNQAKIALSQYGGFECPKALPAWAWEILQRFDNYFSHEMKQDLLLEGSIVITK